MAWPPEFRAATKATCPRSLTAWPTTSAPYGLSGLVSATGVNVYESIARSSRASTLSRHAGGRSAGEGRGRGRARAELGVRERRIEESHMSHHLLPKAVCRRMVTPVAAHDLPAAKAETIPRPAPTGPRRGRTSPCATARALSASNGLAQARTT